MDAKEKILELQFFFCFCVWLLFFVWGVRFCCFFVCGRGGDGVLSALLSLRALENKTHPGKEVSMKQRKVFVSHDGHERLSCCVLAGD